MPSVNKSAHHPAPRRPVSIAGHGVQGTGRVTRPEPSGAPVGLLIFLGLCLPFLIVYGFAVMNEFQVVGVAVALLGLVLILARPFWGLIFFLALLYIRPEESIPQLAGMHFTLLIALVTLFGMVCQMWMDKQAWVRTPLNVMILGFGVAVVLSSIVAGDDPTAAITDIGRLVILVFLIVNLVRTPERFQSTITALVLLTAYLAGYSVYLYFTGGVVHQDGIERTKATGIFADPNDLAATFTAGLALLVPRLLQKPRGSQFFHACLAGILLWAIILTNSRGGTLALGAVFVGYLMAAKMPPKAKWGLVVLAAILYLGVAGGRMTTFDSSEASANSRFWFWDTGIQQLKLHPLTGVGYTHFPDVNGGMTAHNSFVLCFAETGLLGYFFWMGCIYFGFRRANPSGDAPSPALADGAALQSAQNLLSARMSLVAYLVASFWLSHTYSPILYVLMCLPIAAQTASALSLSQSQPELTSLSSPPVRRVPTWGSIALACVASLTLIELMIWHYK